MRPHKFMPLIAALCLFLLAVAGCNSTNGGVGVIASVQVYDVVQSPKPAALARYDGNTLCMWGGGAIQYELMLSAPPNIPLWGPFQAKEGKAYTYQRDPHDKAWTTDIDAPLPAAARVLFRENEILAWGLVFDAPEVAP